MTFVKKKNNLKKLLFIWIIYFSNNYLDYKCKGNIAFFK